MMCSICGEREAIIRCLNCDRFICWVCEDDCGVDISHASSEAGEG